MSYRHLVGADLNLLLVFQAIWRERNITRAAAWLRMTQSGTSHALKRLRELADDPLFVRGDNGVVPTPHAEEIAANISSALDHALSALQRRDAFAPSTATGTIKLGLTDYASAVLLPPVLQRLSAEAPGIAIRGVAIDTRDPLADLDSHSVDLVFGPLTNLPDRFASEQLLAEDLVCLVAGGADLPDRMTREFYLGRPHLVISYDGVTRTWADDLLEQDGLSRNVALTLPHGLAVRDMLLQSDMICTVIEGVARRAAAQGGLRIYPHPLEQRTLSVSQVWHRRLDADPMHRWVRQMVSAAHGA